MADGGEHSLYIVTTADIAEDVIYNMKENNYNRYNINGFVVINKDMTGQKIAGIPVVSDLENAAAYICRQWVDEVLIIVEERVPFPEKLYNELLEMGLVVHMNLQKVKSGAGKKQFVENIGGYTVLTTTMN